MRRSVFFVASVLFLRTEGGLFNKSIFVRADNLLKYRAIFCSIKHLVLGHFWPVSSLKLNIWKATLEAVALVVSSPVQHTSKREFFAF